MWGTHRHLPVSTRTVTARNRGMEKICHNHRWAIETSGMNSLSPPERDAERRRLRSFRLMHGSICIFEVIFKICMHQASEENMS